MNRPLSVKLLKNAIIPNYHQFINAIEKDGKIYFLIGFHYDLLIYTFDPSTTRMSRLIALGGAFSTRMLKLHDHTLWPFYVGNKYFVIGDSDQIIVIQRDSVKHSVIKDIPVNDVAAVTILNNRIYAFMYNNAQGTALMSCLPDGTQRRIHISTLRREKQNLFDRQPPFNVSGLFADEHKQRLLFISCSKYGKVGGLWEFIPEKKQFKKIHGYGKSMATRVGNKLNICPNVPYNLYTYDIITDKLNLILLPYKKYFQKILYDQKINIVPPLLLMNDQMWVGGFGAGFIDLKVQNGLSPIYGLGRGIGSKRDILFFPHPDGSSVFAVDWHNIYKITPPEKINNKEEVVK